MTNSKKELTIEDIHECLKGETRIIAQHPNQSKIINFLMQQIPFITQITGSLDKLGLSTDNLARIYTTANAATNAAKGLKITSIALTGINFVTIPVSWLVCQVTGTDFPYSFSKGVKWIYTGVLLSLMVLSFVFPPFALALGITAAALVVGGETISFFNHFWASSSVSKELKIVDENISAKLDELKNIQKIAVGLSPENDTDEIIALNLQREKHIRNLQQLVNRQAELNAKKQGLGGLALADKTLAIGLSAAGLAGVLVTMAFPPAGLGIILVTTALATSWLLGRVGHGIWSKRKTPPVAPPSANIPAYESTTNISMRLFNGNNVEEKLQEAAKIQQNHEAMIVKVIQEIDEIKDSDLPQNQCDQFIKILCQVKQYAINAKISPETLAEFGKENPELKKFNSMLEKTLKNLSSGAATLNAVNLEDRKILNQIPFMRSALNNTALNNTIQPRSDSQEPSNIFAQIFESDNPHVVE